MAHPVGDGAARREFDDLCRSLLAGEVEEAGLTSDELVLLRRFMSEEELQALFDEAARTSEEP